MASHNGRRHQRARRAARKASMVERQLKTNPQFMTRTRELKITHASGHVILGKVIGVERKAHLIAAIRGIGRLAASAPAKKRAEALEGMRKLVGLPTISSPPTTRQPVKKGPSRSERERQERRAHRQAKKGG
jgi:transposase